MDGWGIAIFVIGLILYYVTKKQAGWLFVSGLGAGIFVGAVWASYLVSQALDRFTP
jgi:hypothetical protein